VLFHTLFYADKLICDRIYFCFTHLVNCCSWFVPRGRFCSDKFTYKRHKNAK